MAETQIRFDDGAAYEQFMGAWSLLAGDEFLRWLAPAPGLRWADVGCGNGAFSELLLERCAPAQVAGIDPSEAQITYARERLPKATARFEVGDAGALPWPDASFGAAVMALVIFFVPDPAKGVAEMARVVKPGGTVCAYAWDILDGGFPYAALQQEMAAAGVTPVYPPRVEAARMEALRALWTGAGLVEIETRQIVVTRRFDDFESFWRIAQTGPRISPALAQMPSGAVAGVKSRLQARLAPDSEGRIVLAATANAIKAAVGR